MAKTKNKPKKQLKHTASGRNLLKKFAVYCGIENADQQVADFCEGRKLENGGAVTSSPVIPEPTIAEPVINTPPPLDVNAGVVPAVASSGFVSPASPEPPAPAFPQNLGYDTKIIEVAGQSANGEIPVSKMVEILGRMPKYEESIGSIFICKVPFAQRWRIKK